MATKTGKNGTTKSPTGTGPGLVLLDATGPGQPTYVLGTQYTLSDVARATNLSLSHVSRVFSGQRTPTVKVARDIATYLELGVGDLLDELGKMQEKTATTATTATPAA